MALAGEPLAALLASTGVSASSVSRRSARTAISAGKFLPMSQSMQADVDDRHAVGQRLDLAPHRHAHGIGAQHDQQIELGQHAAHLLLVAREPAHEAGMLGEEMRAVGRALLVDGRAQRLRELGGGLPARRS